MAERTQTDRDFDLSTGRELERKDAEIDWFRSGLVSLLVLAEAENSPLTNSHVAVICKHMLARESVPQVEKT